MKVLIDPEKLRDALIEAGGKVKDRLEKRGIYITAEVSNILRGTSLPVWAEPAEEKKKNKSWPAVYTAAFDAFWASYPSRGGVKSGKAAAYKAWQKQAATPDNEWCLHDLCLSALGWQCETEQWQEAAGKYIPMASTYLNQKRYEDEAPAAETKTESAPMNWDEFNG